MSSEVAVEGVGVGEGLAAHRAGLQVLSRMRSHVVLQLLLFGEYHTAHLTSSSFLA